MIKTVAFGELLLRLSAPGYERLFQSPTLQASFGGAEANVAASLAAFGLHSCYITRLPANAVGDAAISMLRSLGVETHGVVRGGSRVGIYFSETGASQRASSVVYDRCYSAFSELGVGTLDWDSVLADARWFHWSGITPALGSGPAGSVVEALRVARARGIPVSVDLNFRRKLWSERDAQTAMPPLIEGAELLVANEEDLQTVLGIEVAGADVGKGILDAAAYADAAARTAHEYGVRRVAITLRQSVSATDNGWQALLWDVDGQTHASQRYDIRVVDRVGAGDSFAAGLIYGLVTGRAPHDSLRFAVAASALKHTIPGDVNRVSVEEVDRLAAGDASGRVRR